MNKFAMAAIAVILSAGMGAAEPLLGTWRTAADDNGNSGLIKVDRCGAQLCGTMIKAYGPSGKEIQSDKIGTTIISETVSRGGWEYRGKVYSPDRDKTYKSKLMLNGNTLAVSGCVIGICRDGGTWTKVN